MLRLAVLFLVAPLLGCGQPPDVTQASQLLKQFLGDWKLNAYFVSSPGPGLAGAGISAGATTATVTPVDKLTIVVEQLTIGRPLSFALQYDPTTAKYILNAIALDVPTGQQLAFASFYDPKTARFGKLNDKYQLIVGLPMAYSDSQGWEGHREKTKASIKKKGSGSEWMIDADDISVHLEFRERSLKSGN